MVCSVAINLILFYRHALDFILSDLVHRIRARRVRVRGASVATAQQAPGSVPWTARARVGTLARGLPPRRGVRAPRLHALSFYRFSATSATFSYRDLVLALYSHYPCATFRSTARCPRSCVRAPPRPSCAATATAAAATCSRLWLLIDRALRPPRGHILGPKVFSHGILYGVCIQNMARRCAMTRAAAAHSERGGVVRFRGFVGSPPRAGHFRAAAGR